MEIKAVWIGSWIVCALCVCGWVLKNPKHGTSSLCAQNDFLIDFFPAFCFLLLLFLMPKMFKMLYNVKIQKNSFNRKISVSNAHSFRFFSSSFCGSFFSSIQHLVFSNDRRRTNKSDQPWAMPPAYFFFQWNRTSIGQVLTTATKQMPYCRIVGYLWRLASRTSSSSCKHAPSAANWCKNHLVFTFARNLNDYIMWTVRWSRSEWIPHKISNQLFASDDFCPIDWYIYYHLQTKTNENSLKEWNGSFVFTINEIMHIGLHFFTDSVGMAPGALQL